MTDALSVQRADRRIVRRTALKAALAGLLTLAIGVGVYAGVHARTSDAREVDRGKVSYVTATLLDTPQRYTTSSGKTRTDHLVSTVEWEWDGETVTERLDVDPYAMPGDTMTLVLDQNGQATTKGHHPGSLLGQVIGIPNNYTWIPASDAGLAVFAGFMALIVGAVPAMATVVFVRDARLARQAQRASTTG